MRDDNDFVNALAKRITSIGISDKNSKVSLITETNLSNLEEQFTNIGLELGLNRIKFGKKI